MRRRLSDLLSHRVSIAPRRDSPMRDTVFAVFAHRFRAFLRNRLRTLAPKYIVHRHENFMFGNFCDEKRCEFYKNAPPLSMLHNCGL